ncbi:MAG: helix-turn-helix transcriptional regulator [Dongiaceae bacterium]
MMMGDGRPEATSYRLRRTLLDSQRGVAPLAMLDCAAHMLLYFDEPSMMLRIGLEHLLDRFGATRGDLGIGSPNDPTYRPCAVQRRADCDIPDVLGRAHPNQDRALQSVWQSSRPIYFDVLDDPAMTRLLPMMERVRTRAKMSRRLEYRNRSFGIICIDHTEERRRWNQGDLVYLDAFALNFLSPILAESRLCQAKGHRSLTATERAVVRLAARGLSYKEIAAELNKSPYTVDNQLRRIRERLGVHNQIELVRACGAFL